MLGLVSVAAATAAVAIAATAAAFFLSFFFSSFFFFFRYHSDRPRAFEYFTCVTEIFFVLFCFGLFWFGLVSCICSISHCSGSCISASGKYAEMSLGARSGADLLTDQYSGNRP